MNEKFKELAIQSGMTVSNRMHITQDTLEKFAELIVKDCITIVNSRYMGDNNREDMEVRRCVEDLIKHFGVE